jgi:hypothetical protein
LYKEGQDEQLEEGISNMKAFTVEEVKSMVHRNEITDAPTLSALTLAIAHNKLSMQA